MVLSECYKKETEEEKEMKRKTPIRHPVREHTREGKPVRDYERGHGTRSQKLKKSRVVGNTTDDDTPIGVHAFTTNFTYSNKPGDGESVITISNNYPDAIDEAWEERMDPRLPIAVECVDPDLGAALKWVGKRVRSAVKWGKPRLVEAAHLGAKYTVRATMATGRTVASVARAGVGGAKELGRLTAFGVQKEYIHSLLKLCYQKDKSKRIAARLALKKRFPDIYDMCDFSKETQRRSRKVPETFYLPRGYRVQ